MMMKLSELKKLVDKAVKDSGKKDEHVEVTDINDNDYSIIGFSHMDFSKQLIITIEDIDI